MAHRLLNDLGSKYFSHLTTSYSLLFPSLYSCHAGLPLGSLQKQLISHQPGDHLSSLCLLSWCSYCKPTYKSAPSVICFAWHTTVSHASGLSHIFLPLPHFVFFHSQASLVNLYMPFSEKTSLISHSPQVKTLQQFSHYSFSRNPLFSL